MQSLPYLNSKNRWWGPKWPLCWVSLFVGISQLLAQPTPPTDFLLRHSFDEQTVTFAQLDSATSLEQVNGLERLKFRRTNETRHVDQYIDATGQPATFITDNTVRDNPQRLPYPKYIAITTGATSLYAADGKVLFQQQNLAEVNTALKVMAEVQATSTDAFTFPTVADASAVADDLTTRGYSASVSASGKVIIATKEDRTLTLNLAEGWQEVAVLREGKTWLTDRTVYGTITSGENVPVHRETITHTTLSRGGCMYETSVTFLSNHQIEYGRGHDRSAVKDHTASLGISPNPANDGVLIHFPAAADQQVQVQIIGLLGVRVRQFGALMPAEGDLRLDIKDLPAGLYWLQMTAPGHTVASRFVKN